MRLAPCAAPCLLFFLSLVLPAVAEARASDDHVTRVLFVGNSYTYFNNLPALVSELAKSIIYPLTLELAPGFKMAPDET
jgi:hypothetical protein